MISFEKDKLQVRIHADAEKMGENAANDIYNKITELLKEKDEINIIFAAAPSQNTTLDALVKKDIDWSRINAFHMDEYIGLTKPDAAFCKYLEGRIFGKVAFKSVNYINAQEKDIEKECKRYSELLQKYPTDIVILGIGENGHIAFNDPPVADFNDSALVKPVELDLKCRNQQVHDGCFDTLDEVPTHALTLTVPALTRAKAMFCVVPYATKADAVYEMLTTDKIDEHCPATALRLHGGAILYCDALSASKLTMRIKSKNIILEDRVFDGYLYIKDGKIVEVTDKELPFDLEEDYQENYVAPGFVDIHLHGGFSYDFLTATKEEIKTAANFHLKHGSTAILPTLLSANFEEYKKALANLKETMGENIVGVHIEGPYFAENMCGGQNCEFITDPIKEHYTYLIENYGDIIKRWSYAPERDKNCEFLKALCKANIIASAGHTEAIYEDMQKAYENGLSMVTHLYSCTSTVTREKGFRHGGVIEYTFANDDIIAEIITDGAHLPNELINLVYKIKGKEKTVLVTDALKVAGTKEKQGMSNGVEYVVEDGVCKLADRSAFAGSIATANVLVRTCKNAGINLCDCIYMASTLPAKLLSLNKGKLEKGFDADIVVFDENIDVISVFLAGNKI